MHRRLIFLIILTVLGITLTGCGPKAEEATVIVAGNYDQTLSKLFPQQEGYEWEYYGTADYAHRMTVDKIYEANSQKVIKVIGEVADSSEGESNLDFGLEITYAIESDRVTQMKLSDTMLDSEYDRLTLIMSPLKIGTSWEEIVIDSQGKKTRLTGEIIEIEEDEAGAIYKVIYKEDESDYSEVRKIQEGRGVIDFIKTLKYEDQSLEMAYHLYQSGGPKTEKVQNARISEVDQIKGVIFKFDELWIDYVNQGETGVMDYVAKDSPVAKMIFDYVRDETKQKYLSIEVQEVNIEGDTASAIVYEKIQQTNNGETSIYEYHWTYRLDKIGEMWFIHSYEEN